MLRIFRGRDNIDKEKFIYDRIAEEGGLHTVLVPDQYTLAAERQALSRMDRDVLLEVEISSITRLGNKVLKECGDGGMRFVNKYGRHMLLSRILAKHENELTVFGAASKRESFIAAVNDFISGAKQFEIKPEDLEESASSIPGDLLGRKMKDLRLIYEAYEKEIQGKLTDTEDLLDLFIERIARSAYVKERSFWLYGFDSFTPKNRRLVMALAEHGASLNIVLTYGDEKKDKELFALGDIVTGNLVEDAKNLGLGFEVRDLKPEDDDVMVVERAEGVKALEEKLFNLDSFGDNPVEGIKLLKAANPYNEAESAAAFVLYLLNEKEYRYRDIVIICNDEGERTSIINRIFQEYGLDIFSDRTRPILSSPIAIYITGLLETVAMGYRTGDLFRVLKTGLAGLSLGEIEKLENYAFSYNIKGSMWKKPFVKGAAELGENEFNWLEKKREKAIKPFLAFEEIYKGKKTVAEFVYKYYEYLAKESGLGKRIIKLAEEQQRGDHMDLAEETLQIWDSIMECFQQLEELIGEEPFMGKEVLSMLVSGLSQIEVGVLPPTSDDILLGNMQRTRCGDIKALLVVGANEGILPLGASTEVLFSDDEIEKLREDGKELGLSEEIRQMEENLAIYRNFAKPSEVLYMSYSVSDSGGEKSLASQFFDRVREIFPSVEVEEDVLNREDISQRLGGEINTLRHYTEAMKALGRGEKISGDWKTVEELLNENDSSREKLEIIKAALRFDNVQKPIPPALAKALFHRDGDKRLGENEYSFSPTRLEKFSRCPFDHFISYGLRPREQRVYTAAAREIGDLYHDVLMEYSLRLNREGTWMTIEKEESDRLVDELIEQKAESYKEGLFNNSNYERYWMRRARYVCYLVCWNLVLQMREGNVEGSFYEEGFYKAEAEAEPGIEAAAELGAKPALGGEEAQLPPITMEVEGGTVYIEGRIDRVDLLPGDRVKIIDYKTGKEHFKVKEAAQGYRLQLMLYLKAAMGEVKDDSGDGNPDDYKKPAGVFYFLISNPSMSAESNGESIEELKNQVNVNLFKSFKLNGVMVNDDGVIRNIAGDFDGFSPILPVKKTKDGIQQTAKPENPFLLTEEEFKKLQDDVDKITKGICEDILAGKIDIHPKRSGNSTPCTYCNYKGICRFDLSFKGCKVIEVK